MSHRNRTLALSLLLAACDASHEVSPGVFALAEPDAAAGLDTLDDTAEDAAGNPWASEPEPDGCDAGLVAGEVAWRFLMEDAPYRQPWICRPDWIAECALIVTADGCEVTACRGESGCWHVLASQASGFGDACACLALGDNPACDGRVLGGWLWAYDSDTCRP